MVPPLISLVTWNRMGLTMKNLQAMLKSNEDFELFIADNHSKDETWNYIESLKDERIKSKVRFDANRGQVFGVNYNLSKRKKGQYFITLDSDVGILTEGWIGKFMAAFDQFHDLGLLGAVSASYYGRYRHPLVRHEKNGILYLELKRGFVEGCCQCLRPELLDQLGYWNEENCMGDVEMCHRICNCTSYKAGFFPMVEIDQQQWINCSECEANGWCKLAFKERTCFKVWEESYGNVHFKALYGHKYENYVRQLREGRRSPYCASIHDEASLQGHFYDKQSAEENFRFYMNNT